MPTRVNSRLIKKLSRYGKGDWNHCFNCGTCTAECSLSETGFMFPRKTIKQAQLGLEQSLMKNLDPWLCYYCGDCSEKCPQDANPGELMMSIRRWMTARYDWTGLSGLFYRSVTFLIVIFALIAAVITGVGYMKNFDYDWMLHFGHQLELFMILVVFTCILAPNLIRMFYLTVINEKVRFPAVAFIGAFVNLFVHLFTQPRTFKCEKQTLRWGQHFFVVVGYLGLLVITVFLNWFEAESPLIIYSGYITGGLVFLFTLTLSIARFSKTRELNRYSHQTDWFFIIWLFLMGTTAVIVRLMIDLGTLEQNFWMYMVHIIILAQWGAVLVPFGKWTHFLYRSFAVAFANLRKASAKVNLKPVLN